MIVFLILWEILKFILLLLALLLIAVLIGIGVTLFVPFKWKAEVSKYENFHANAQCTWLFGICKFGYLNDSIYVRIFGINILNVLNVLSKKASKTDEREPPPHKPKDLDKSDDSSETSKFEDKGEDIDIDPVNTKDYGKKPKVKKASKINALLDKIKNIIEKIKGYNKQINLKALAGDTKIFLKKVAKAILPKECKVDLIIGMDEPHTTGYILAVLGVVSDYIPVDLQTTGVFDKEIVQGGIYANGNLYIYQIMVPSVRYVLSKSVRKVIRLALTEIRK